MIALDLFLYDNQTWSPRWGRDWGLKAATGALATRADLKAGFDRYCELTSGEQGQISGFGEALGGVRPPSGDGYLLCVTLETSDAFGRPSWAVCGLWCPDPAAMELVLSAGDPIGSARALLGAEAPANAVEIRSARLAISPRSRRCAWAGTAFHRFDPQSTTREVIALLLGSLRGKTALPNILGITATPHLEQAAGMGFDVVYCRPMEERTERALGRVLSSPEPDEEEPLHPLIPAKAPAAGSVVPSRARSRTPPASSWPLWLSVGVAAAVAVSLLVHDPRRNAPRRSPESTFRKRAEIPVPPAPFRGSSAAPPRRTAAAALREIRDRLEECKRLAPDKLRRSDGFTAAETLAVLPEHQAQREQVRHAYSALLEIRERMVKRRGRGYIAYYFDEAGQGTAPALKLQKIKALLSEAPLGREDCKLLQADFAFEFEDGGSAVSLWCDSLQRLEQTATQSLPGPEAARKD